MIRKFFRACWVILPLLLGSFAFSQQKELPITEWTENKLSDAILVDVRTPAEYSRGHLDHAINIDWYSNDFPASIKGLDKEKTIYLYCQKGGRSAKAAQRIEAMGYRAVDLTGGYQAYSESKATQQH